MNILQICPPYLSDVTTLPWKIQKSHFNIIIKSLKSVNFWQSFSKRFWDTVYFTYNLTKQYSAYVHWLLAIKGEVNYAENYLVKP